MRPHRLSKHGIRAASFGVALGLAAAAGATSLLPQGAEPFNQQIASPTFAQGARFGTSVAVSGITAAVGAPGDTASGPDSGAVHIFQRNDLNGAYEIFQTIRPSEVGPFDRFGEAIALGGNLLIVGAKGDDTVAPNAGAVYVFRRFGVGNPYQLTNKFTAPNGGISDCFGTSVAVNGNVIAVGAPRSDETAFDAGSVYTYKFDFAANTATLDLLITDPDGAAGDGFGAAVVIAPTTLAVGAERLDAPSGQQNTGGVVVYESSFNGANATWTKVQTIFPTSPSSFSGFGSALALLPPRVGVTGTLVVGAPDAENPQTGSAKGSVSIYSSDLPVQWSLDHTYGLNDLGNDSRLGASVAVQDGIVLAGAPGRYPAGSQDRQVGSVDLLRQTSSGGWVVERAIELPEAGDAWFAGSAVAISEGYPLIGAPGVELSPSFDGEGAAWFVSHTWAPFGELLCSPAVPNSTGQSASLVARGSDITGVGDLTLEAAFLPQFSFAYALVSRESGFAATPGLSQGNICVTGVVGRMFDVFQQSGLEGRITIPVDLSMIPQPLGPVAVVPGDIWWFQVWYRDANPLVTSNFTDAIGVQFK